MNALLLRKIWRDMQQFRARTGLAIAALGIALLAAGTVLAALEIMQQAISEQFLRSQPVSATLRFDHVSPELLAAVRAQPEIAAVRARRVWSTTVHTEQGTIPLQLFAYQDWTPTDLGRLQPIRGNWPPAPNTIVLEQSALTLLAADQVETLEVLAATSMRQLTISGVARDVALAPAWMEHVAYGFADIETLQSLGAAGGFDSLQFRVRDPNATRASVREVAATINRLAHELGLTLRAVDVPQPGEHIHARQMNSLLLTQAAFGIAAIVAALFLFYNLTTAMLAREARQIAVLKTIGAGPTTILMLYLCASATQGLLAALLVLPVVAYAGSAYGALKLSMLNFDPSMAALAWRTLLLLLAIGALAPMLASLGPVLRTLGVPVLAGLLQGSDGIGHASWRLPGRALLPVPMRWALDQAFRQPRRALLSVLGLGLGGAIFLAAASVRVAVQGAVDHLFRSQRYDVMLLWSEPPPTTLLAQVSADVPAVLKTEVWSRKSVALTAQDGLIEPSFPLLGIPANSEMLALSLSSGRMLTAGSARELVVSRALQIAQPTLRVGAEVVLLDTGAEPWRVIGAFDAGPQAMAYAPIATVQPLSGARLSLLVQGRSQTATAQLAMIQALTDAFGNAGWTVSSSRRPDANREAIEDHLLMVLDFLRAMGVVMLVVAWFNLTAVINLGVLERQREIAVLRAIGATPTRIGRLILLESLSLALFAWVFSIAVAWPAATWLAQAFGRIMFTLPAVTLAPLKDLLAWLFICTIVAFLASLWPTWQAKRLSVAEVLQGA
ncbi:hypothetical protein C7S18_03980 [Ahniella affigens]|uniref:Uncharacterized protein n=1 Tax=Ahniella affigens TaxID=2021234 RepID=A0A2P1PNJ2_9GAMM|nr:FtsX-like permease family protein [Ahniella affigens]AVP96402.1 hypothetical protein C7S18_03980 [Ahniella affigens]